MHILRVDTADKIQALKVNEYFEHLSEPDLHSIAECMSLRAFERGEALFWEGEASAGLHIVHQGSIKLYRLSPQGRQYIVRIPQEKETFNEVSVFAGDGNPVNAEALESCKVWVVAPEYLRQLVGANPDFAQKVINNLGKNLRKLVVAVSEMAFYQVTHRLARLISQLPQEELSGQTASHLTQDQLAARLGTVREVVARSLRELEHSGAIRVENRRILVADAEALAQWLQGP